MIANNLRIAVLLACEISNKVIARTPNRVNGLSSN